MSRVLTPEDFGLGRRFAPDRGDARHLMAERVALPSLAEAPNSRYWFQNGWWGNQGSTPECVAYAWTHLLEDGPVTQNVVPPPIVDPDDLYHEAQKNDEWPGEDYDGTSVRAGAKVLQDRGFLPEYVWAHDVDTLLTYVLTKGPVVMGTNWYQGMFYPDPKTAVIHPTGYVAGGHAWVINGANKRNGLFRMKNSWGRDWGRRGNAFLEAETLAKLLEEEGEACAPTEKRATHV